MTYDGRTRVVIMAEPRPDAIDMVMRVIPKPGRGEALVKIRKAGICGTDLHLISWNPWAQRSYKPPFALGHELCGEIVDIEGDDRFRVGDRVTAETHLACGNCYQCRIGRGHTCDNLKTFSRLDQGAFADYAVIPCALLRKVPEGLSDEVASIMEPVGISVRAVSEASATGGALLISGCGPIGLFAVAAAKRMGVLKVVTVDPVQERRDLAVRLGADVSVCPRSEDFHTAVRSATDGQGADASIETSGVEAALASAFMATRKGGRVVCAGLPSTNISIDLTGQIVLREISLSGIYGRLLDQTWLDVERLLSSSLDVSPIITDIFELENYRCAIAQAQSGRSGKVVFDI